MPMLGASGSVAARARNEPCWLHIQYTHDGQRLPPALSARTLVAAGANQIVVDHPVRFGKGN